MLFPCIAFRSRETMIDRSRPSASDERVIERGSISGYGGAERRWETVGEFGIPPEEEWPSERWLAFSWSRNEFKRRIRSRGQRGKHHSDVNATRLHNMLADATPAAEIIQKRAPNFRMLIYERRVPLLESSGDQSIRVVHAELCTPAAYTRSYDYAIRWLRRIDDRREISENISPLSRSRWRSARFPRVTVCKQRAAPRGSARRERD